MIGSKYEREYATSQTWTRPDSQAELYDMGLGKDTTISLLQREQQFHEGLLFGDIPLDAILDTNHRTIALSRFFREGIHWDEDTAAHVNARSNEDFIYGYEFFLKMVWLSREFIANDYKYSFPVGTHWNPRMRMVVPHPGVVRTEVARLFTDTIYGYYFATRGFRPSFTKDLQDRDYRKIINDPNAACLLSPDHGTLIPHISYRNGYILENVHSTHLRISKRFKQYRVVSPVDLSDIFPHPLLAGNPDNNITINFAEKPTPDMRARAVLATCYPERYVISDEFEVHNPDGHGTLKI